jgi:hypothetical protein
VQEEITNAMIKPAEQGVSGTPFWFQVPRAGHMSCSSNQHAGEYHTTGILLLLSELMQIFNNNDIEYHIQWALNVLLLNLKSVWQTSRNIFEAEFRRSSVKQLIYLEVILCWFFKSDFLFYSHYRYIVYPSES